MSLFQVTKKQVIENYELRTMTGDIVSFTPSYSQLLPDPFSDLNVTVNVLATGGNGTPDNPNPINGYTKANIVNTQNESIADLFSIDSDFRGTVAFNQFASFSSRDIPSASHGITYLSDDNKSVTINGTANAGELRTGWFNLSESTDLTLDKLGHKFVFISKIISGSYNGKFEIKLGNSAFYNVGESFITTLGYSVPQSQQIRFSTNIYNGTICDNLKVTFICVDLTAMFGSTIADYIYSLEQATAGAGVAFFRSIYPADYYDYDSGTNELVGKIIPNATIAFGQTVYGGVLDVTRGKLHVTWGICDLADYNYTYNSTHGAFYTYGLIGTIKAGTANILCTHYKTNIVGVNVMNNYEISTVNSFNTGNVIIKDSDYTDAAAFKTALGTMGVKLAFELDTPFDIDLTPEVISAIVGTNNVFADCGETTVTCLI